MNSNQTKITNPKLSTYIKTFVDDSAKYLSPYVLTGRFNNEFISGNQYKKINIVSLSIEDKKVDASVYTERKVFNRMLPIYLTRYGILTQNMPIPGIIPNSSTSKSVKDSLTVNNFIRSFMADIEFKHSIYQKAIKRADVYGIEWFKTGIDWSDGDEICDIPVNLNGQKGRITLHEGKLFIQNVPIHEIFIDSYYVESMDEVNELVHRRVFPVEYIRKRWGFPAEKENVTDTKLAVYPRYTNYGLNEVGDIEYAYIYEYYKKPDAMYPDGRYVVMCNDCILYDDILPYVNAANNKRVIPFDFMVMQNVPNKLIGVTVYSQLIPIQETYNAIKNRYLEYMNHIAIGQLYVWEGSLVNKNNFSTKPGKLIGLKRNSKAPQPVQKDRLSQEFISYIKSLEEDMLITAGLSQMAAFGQTKSNVRTDGVVDKLSESDENKLVNALDNISDVLISVFKKILHLEKERQNTLYKQLEVAKAPKCAFKYNLANVDVEQLTIVNRDFLMTSDQVFDKKLQQAGNFGIYNPQSGLSYQSKLEFLGAIQANYLKDTLDPNERATYELCVEENYLLLSDNKQIPTVESYHVHAAHINYHQLFRISPEVRALEKEDPKRYAILQEAIDKHIKDHQNFLQSSQQNNVYANAKALFQGTAKE